MDAVISTKEAKDLRSSICRHQGTIDELVVPRTHFFLVTTIPRRTPEVERQLVVDSCIVMRSRAGGVGKKCMNYISLEEKADKPGL
eukprot:scaffold11103_cov117-Cylindrotheca_fusiformis.AAC.2